MIEAKGRDLDYDAVILGAGAAGLLAAIHAAERGGRVLLVEKNRRPGVKILMSGGTRCNLTNARGLRRLEVVSGPVSPEYDPRQARGARGIQEAFGVNGAFLGPALCALDVEATIARCRCRPTPSPGTWYRLTARPASPSSNWSSRAPT